MSEVEKKIVEKRLIGVSFCQLDSNSQRVVMDKIILKGAAIFGCLLPQTEGFAESLSEEITELIISFGCSELTEQEIYLSMMLNTHHLLKYPSGIEIEKISFSGACINTTFLSKVFSNYMDLRKLIDRKFQIILDEVIK